MKSLEYALQTENEGIEFYLSKAEANKENSLHKLFIMIAKDELRHAGIIRKLMQGILEDLPENETLASFTSIFRDAEEVMSDVYSSSEQLNVYRLAREIEKKGMDVYHQMLADSHNPKEKEIYQYLLDQEREHYSLFDELVTRVSRPEEWVESAEFGPREEY